MSNLVSLCKRFRDDKQHARSTMEAEERPTKMRKLDQDIHGEASLGMVANSTNSAIKREVSEERKLSQEDDAVVDAEENGGHLLEAGDGSVKTEHQNDTHSADDELPPPEEFAPLANSDEVRSDGPVVSKNQLKKLRKKREWESKRGERKLIRKEKLVEKRERKRAARQQESNDDVPMQNPPPRRKKHFSQRPVQLPVTILIDCDFDDLMRDNERISLASQITRCYSDNKNSLFRAHLGVCSFGGKLRERFDRVLDHYKGWRGVRFLDCDFVEAAERAEDWMADPEDGGKLSGSFSSLADPHAEETVAILKEESEIVYLSSEASETLTELRPFSTYIIGGLVDKNREKGVCYKRATQRGVRTAKLPIGEYLQMSSRKVLATNHVNEIMLKWLDTGDWGDALVKVIPKRKGGQLRDAMADQEGDEELNGGDSDGEDAGNDAATAASSGARGDGLNAASNGLDAGATVAGGTT
ncbi:hypothetical protein B0A55_03519 [Friedmanniomyces simplex]|uniref:tRNA (guanine(9)-N1)-methyltransferase n=1 Tax=Friedmanniomyces simplex TaxID=329884 RepID=A0A4U0XHJ7_9PEZI|nr:hypothetical protein B0A55_03519 [Friedmanniomyces simplex]